MSEPVVLTEPRPLAHRFSRYTVVSVISTILGLSLLYILNEYVGMSASVANLVSGIVSAPPIYYLSSRWAWKDSHTSSDAVSFAQYFAALIVSIAIVTAIVEAVDQVWGDGLIAVAAAFVGYGVVWVVRFAFLDMIVFQQ